MVQGSPGLLRDLELDRTLGLLLHDGGSRGHVTSLTDDLNQKSREIAHSNLLAIDCEIEHCELCDVRSHLKPSSDCPNFSEV